MLGELTENILKKTIIYTTHKKNQFDIIDFVM